MGFTVTVHPVRTMENGKPGKFVTLTAKEGDNVYTADYLRYDG